MGLGKWLVVSEPLQPARAIAVLAGNVPYNAIEAARLFHGGEAPEVQVTCPADPWRDRFLNEMKIPHFGDDTYSIDHIVIHEPWNMTTSLRNRTVAGCRDPRPRLI